MSTCRNCRAVPELTHEQLNHDQRQKEINGSESKKRNGEMRHRRHSLRSTHHTLNYPRLSADFSNCPSSLDRDESKGRYKHHRPQKPRLSRQEPPPSHSSRTNSEDQRHNPDQSHQQSAGNHYLKRYVHDAHWRTIGATPFLEPAHCCIRIVKSQEAETTRNFQSIRSSLGLCVRYATNPKRCAPLGFELSFKRRELLRLSARDEPGVEVAADWLRHRRSPTNYQRNAQSQPVEHVVAIATQHECVDAGHYQSGCRITGDRHVNRLGNPRRIEHRSDGIDVHRLSVHNPESRWSIHPPIYCHDED